MPNASAITAAAKDSSSVAGKRSTSSVDTDAAWRRLMPNSPCTAWPAKRANCTERRLVQAEAGAQLRALLGRGLLAHQIGDRVADVLEQHECDQRDDRHHGDGLGQTAKDEGEHGRRGVPQAACPHAGG
jgi:hypothetical protein